MICEICPRHCKAERTERTGAGVCGMPEGPVVARAALHRWEEPCISGTRGAGTVFFSGCNLGCVFCQNGKISHENFGQRISVQRLREIFHELAAQGAHNIDLVSPTQFAPWIRQALQEPLEVPVIWNSGGYDSVETLRTLEGKIQIYLPDFKYALPELAGKFSAAADYVAVVKDAVDEMFRQVGPYQMGEDGLLRSGVVLRHLVLPGQIANTKAVIDYVAERFAPGEVLFSLMSQYTPQAGADGVLARRITGAEYRAAVQYMNDCGLTDGFCQGRESANASYTPSFDLQGVLDKGFK